jgi:hypothetical protein
MNMNPGRFTTYKSLLPVRRTRTTPAWGVLLNEVVLIAILNPPYK